MDKPLFQFLVDWVRPLLGVLWPPQQTQIMIVRVFPVALFCSKFDSLIIIKLDHVTVVY